MGYASKSVNVRRGLPKGLMALILTAVIIGAVWAPASALAASIGCGQCHGTAPLSSSASEQATGHRTGFESTPGYEDQKTPVDPDICNSKGRGLHGIHMNYSSTSYGKTGSTQTVAGVTYARRGNCNYCHGRHIHENGFVEFSGYAPAGVMGTAKTVAVASGGSGYAVGDTITINAGDHNAYTTVKTVSGGAITALNSFSGGSGYGGSGYSVANGLATTTSGSGTGATVNITAISNNGLRQSITSAPVKFSGTGMGANGLNMDQMDGTGTCTTACHKRTSASNPAPWGNYTSPSVKLSCSSCHGDFANTTGISGAHAAHVRSVIPTGGTNMNAPNDAGCVNCHPDNTGEGKLPRGTADFGAVKAYPHAQDGTNVVSANANVNSGVIGGGTRSGLNTTCTGACHHNTNTAKWGDGSLACDACHYHNANPTYSGNSSAVVKLGRSHGQHFSQAAVCANCHSVPAAGDTTHVTALPVNAANATVSAGLTYNTTAKTCASTGTSCHGTGNTTPAWGNPLGLAECALCHQYPNSSNPWPSANTHLIHITASQFNAATDIYTSVVKSQTKCGRCHNNATHRSGSVEVSSALAPGLTYNTTNQNCTNACHSNKNAVWGGSADCNTCHFRKGQIGSVAPSGLHVTQDKSWKHYSSVIKVNGLTVTCSNCHPNNDSDTGSPKAHISSTNFVKRADMSEAHTFVTVTGIGYVKGALPTNGTCAKSCHYNASDPFGNYTICFKPGQKRRFGAYQTATWGDNDLKCNECHSTPSQEATFRSLTSTAVYGGYTTFASRNANKRHEQHMFEYKLNPWNFQNEDRNIYCDDCHRTPDINTLRGFRNHSTYGEGGSGIISLPVKSQNSKVNLSFRNNGKGRDGVNPATFVRGTCSNVYCHTIAVKAQWTEEACDSCHGTKDGVNVGSGAPGYVNWTSNFRTFEDYSGGGGAHYTHVTKRGYPCRTCHYDGGGDGNPLNHHNIATQVDPVGDRIVRRANVNVGVQPAYWFNNRTSFYDKTTRSCSDVKCHYGASQNWDCPPLH